MANLTSAINVNAPTEVKKPTSSKEFSNALQELDYMERHPDEYQSFHSVKELMEDLNSDA